MSIYAWTTGLLFLYEPHGRDLVPNNEQIGDPAWQWCLVKNVSLSAEYLPGPDNGIADAEFRRTQSLADWKEVFQQIIMVFGKLLGGPVSVLAQCPADAVCELEG